MATSSAKSTPAADKSESLIFLYPSRGSPYLEQVKMRLQKRKALEVVEAESPAHIAESILMAGSGVLFVCVQDFRDLKLVLKCMAELKPLIQDRSLRVMGVTEMDDPRATRLLKARGCPDLYPSNLIWSSLEAYINYSISILLMQRILAQHPCVQTGPRVVSSIDKRNEDPFDSDLNPELKIWIGSSDPADTRLVEATLLEYSEDTLRLEVGANNCTEGHDAYLILEDPSQKFETKYKVLVKLGSVVPTEADRQLVSIGLESGMKKFLEPTRKVRAKLQRKILDFLKAARGW